MDAKKLFGLEGKRFIILGGGRGMGEATALLLADLGADVAILDIIEERAVDVAAAVSAKGVRGIAVIADVLDDDALVAGIDKAERELGPLDGMVTIVGMAYMGAAIDVPMEVWDADHRRNLRYIFLGAREVAKRLIARGAPGAIASIASVDGMRASTNHAAYGAAKAGLVHMAQSLAAEWSGHGVRMNVVAPGAITTKRITQQSAPASGPNGLAMVPMQRPGQIPEIAKTLVFLVSDMASYITGQTIAVDGGLTAVGPIDYSGLAAHKGVIGAGDEVKKSVATAS